MVVKILHVSNRCKNVLGIKWVEKKLWCQIGVKVF